MVHPDFQVIGSFFSIYSIVFSSNIILYNIFSILEKTSNIFHLKSKVPATKSPFMGLYCIANNFSLISLKL